MNPMARATADPEARDQALRADIRLLGNLLGDALVRHRGQELLDHVEHVRALSKGAVAGEVAREELDAALEAVDLDEAIALARAFSAYFQLANVAEQTHRIDELTQEAMVRVYERWDRVRQMGSPQGYLFRTALNLHRSRLRWLATRARQILQPTSSPDPAEVVQSRDSLDRALASLPTGQRGAVVLVEWLGMDPQEAARALGIKPGSVRARLSRAKAALREMLEDEDA
jgi:RNA polymerase sigma factor (sigma-70 family)